MRTVATLIIGGALFVSSTPTFGCGPEGSLAGSFGGAPRFAKSGGFGAPGFAQNQMMMPQQAAMFAAAQMNQHRQMLAMQAAARRDRRRPIKLAKAIALREQKLAARESRKAWVLAKQEERLRKEAESKKTPTPSMPSQGEVMVASYSSSFTR